MVVTETLFAIRSAGEDGVVGWRWSALRPPTVPGIQSPRADGRRAGRDRLIRKVVEAAPGQHD